MTRLSRRIVEMRFEEKAQSISLSMALHQYGNRNITDFTKLNAHYRQPAKNWFPSRIHVDTAKVTVNEDSLVVLITLERPIATKHAVIQHADCGTLKNWKKQKLRRIKLTRSNELGLLLDHGRGCGYRPLPSIWRRACPANAPSGATRCSSQ